MATNALLQIDSLGIKYDGATRYALKDVSFSINRGTFLTVLGESGSGKSSLLKLLGGEEQATKGKIYHKGKKLKGPVEKMMKGYREIKLVKQDYDVFPNHTLEEVLQHPIRKLLSEEQNALIKESLKYFELQQYAKKKPHELSGGMQQRLAIAYALISEPDVLLLDEPFSHLDARRKSLLVSLLNRVVRDKGISIILVTHDVQDALMYSDRMMILVDGVVLQRGRPSTLYKKPENGYVAELMGDGSHLTSMDIRVLVKALKSEYSGYRGGYLRPELVKQNSNGIKAYVKESLYQGDKWLTMIDCEGVELKTFTPNALEAGETILVKFSLEDIILLSN